MICIAWKGSTCLEFPWYPCDAHGARIKADVVRSANRGKAALPGISQLDKCWRWEQFLLGMPVRLAEGSGGSGDQRVENQEGAAAARARTERQASITQTTWAASPEELTSGPSQLGILVLACANDGENDKRDRFILCRSSYPHVLGLDTCATIFSCSLKAVGDKDACLVLSSSSFPADPEDSPGCTVCLNSLLCLLDATPRCVFPLIYPWDTFIAILWSSNHAEWKAETLPKKRN